MKEKILASAMALFILNTSLFSQELKYDWKNMKPQQRKEAINKMSPKERMSLLQQFRENMVVSELEVPQQNQDEFKTLYAEYQQKQKEIRSKFTFNENYDGMSDEEADKELNQSFQIGQELLDNRRKYAERFRKIVKPQQVLQLFQTEGKMREKVMEKRNTNPENANPENRNGQQSRVRRP